MTLTQQVLSTLPGDVLSSLRQLDERWHQLRSGPLPTPQMIQCSQDAIGCVDWDVVVSGGTLGILIATSLVSQGLKVALLEQGVLKGRKQEWNISRRELTVLLELDLLSEAELDRAIVTEFNPVRVAFTGGPEFWVKDVLNTGVDPEFLLAILKTTFLQRGGCLFEKTAFQGATVHPDGVRLEGSNLTARLLLDVMGHFSPIARQARAGQAPDSVCLVVGSCAQGYPANSTGDLMVSFTNIRHQCQYFWEAFPARDGRTTYLFTYADLHPDRPSLEFLYEEYLQLLPQYQDIDLADLSWQRALFGFFPAYRQSPLPSTWDRILHLGDSSGAQSPLSFGGFGAMMRHLKRLTEGIQEALSSDALNRKDLSLLQPYQPNLSVTGLFQKAMSVRVDQPAKPEQVNQLLSVVFQELARSGDKVLKPFLQDVVQFSALSETLLKVAVSHPQLVAQLIPAVGWLSLLDWIG
ncbi:MAG: FAD-binding oxidoreductase, partial [Leptolyngbyaceae cyanobacterium bins.59]|nr:FAD-binding oxidoreductase [Leptolyngbyaceae cyanobacterium bins.59]